MNSCRANEDAAGADDETGHRRACPTPRFPIANSAGCHLRTGCGKPQQLLRACHHGAGLESALGDLDPLVAEVDFDS